MKMMCTDLDLNFGPANELKYCVQKLKFSDVLRVNPNS